VSEKPATNGKNLRERITDACAAVDPDIPKIIQINMIHRLRKYVVVGSGHVEHTLSKQKNVVYLPLFPDFSDTLYIHIC
jgi:hypothetical protein